MKQRARMNELEPSFCGREEGGWDDGFLSSPRCLSEEDCTGLRGHERAASS